MFFLKIIWWDLLRTFTLSKFQDILGKTFYPNSYNAYLYDYGFQYVGSNIRDFFTQIFIFVPGILVTYIACIYISLLNSLKFQKKSETIPYESMKKYIYILKMSLGCKSENLDENTETYPWTTELTLFFQSHNQKK